MASRTTKRLAGICCFLRSREWFCLGTEHLLLLLRISSQWTRQIVEPSWSSTALANSLDRKYFLPAHLRLLLLAFHIMLRKNRTTKPTQQGELREKNLPLPRVNAPETLSFFVAGANTKPLGASA